jgi:hypothetical protein
MSGEFPHGGLPRRYAVHVTGCNPKPMQALGVEVERVDGGLGQLLTGKGTGGEKKEGIPNGLQTPCK